MTDKEILKQARKNVREEAFEDFGRKCVLFVLAVIATGIMMLPVEVELFKLGPVWLQTVCSIYNVVSVIGLLCFLIIEIVASIVDSHKKKVEEQVRYLQYLKSVEEAKDVYK